MRIDEIQSTDEKIHKLMAQYFESDPYTINDKGYVSVLGNCDLIMHTAKIPVKFGNTAGNFSCNEVGLTSLQNSPPYVQGKFFCYMNELSTLIGGPELVAGLYSCNDNELSSLIGAPKKVGDNFFCLGNPLVSLEGLPREIHGECILPYYENLPLLKLVFINHLQKVKFRGLWGNSIADDVSAIVTKYLRQGRQGALQCAAELTKAGFKGNAKL